MANFELFLTYHTMPLTLTEHQPLIEAQLERILESDSLKNSELLKRFLKLVVTKTIKGESAHLKEYVIGVEALGRPIDFNPQTDASVRIHATRLRKQLAAYYANEGQADKVRITIPKGRYVACFQSHKQKDLQRNIASMRERTVIGKPVIALFPFRGITANESLERFCAVLLHELSTELAKFTELGVISEYSVNEAHVKVGNVDDVIQSLNLSYILTGFYAFTNNRWKVTIELNDVRNKQIVWNESYPIDDIDKVGNFDFQTIVRKVLAMICGYMGIIYRNACKCAISEESEYLYAIYWYNYYHQHFSPESFEASLKACEAGLKLYPNNALLASFKAQLFLDLKVMDIEGDIDYLEYGTQLAYQAADLDLNCQHAWMVISWAHLLNHEKELCEIAFKKMFDINPFNHMYYSMLGFIYVCMGAYDKGFAIMTESVKLNPYYAWNLNVTFCLYYVHQGDYHQALLYANLINRKSFIWDPLLRIAIHGLMQNASDCTSIKNELAACSPDFSKRARKIIAAFLLDSELQNTIIGGLMQAGVSVED